MRKLSLRIGQIGCGKLAPIGAILAQRRRALVLCAMGLGITMAASMARAEVITESATAPASYEIGQPDSSVGLGGGDYSNSWGPPAQSFTPASNFNLSAVTVLGGGDAGEGDDTTIWGVTISLVNSNNTVTVLDTETTTFWPSSSSDYLTFTLDNPVALTAGTQYAYSISTVDPGDGHWTYYGFAKSSTDVYAGGNAFEEGGTSGTVAPVGQSDGILDPQPSADRTFFVEGGVPEPMGLSVIMLGAIGLLQRRRTWTQALA